MIPDVSLVVISDRPRSLPVLLASLQAQTLENWECLVLDQGGAQCFNLIQRTPLFRNDPRIAPFLVRRHNDWGQTEKAYYATHFATGRILGFPNDDAYYAPPFLERMVQAIDANPPGLAYCDWIYDAAGYSAWTGCPEIGRIDVGGFLISREIFLATGWQERDAEGDGKLVRRVINAGHPATYVPGFFYVKN